MERGPFWIRLWIMIIKNRCIALQHKCLLWFFYLIVNCTWLSHQYNVSIGLFGWYLRIFSYLSFCVKFSMYILSWFVYKSWWLGAQRVSVFHGRRSFRPEHYCEAILMCEVYTDCIIGICRCCLSVIKISIFLGTLITDKRWYLCNKISLLTSF